MDCPKGSAQAPGEAHTVFIPVYISFTLVHKHLRKIHTAQDRRAELRRPSPGGTLCTQSLGSDTTMELSVTKGCPYLVLGSLCQQESQWLSITRISPWPCYTGLSSAMSATSPAAVATDPAWPCNSDPRPNEQLSPGPLSCSPVAPAEEDTGKEECPL